jgi:hypothetical protein
MITIEKLKEYEEYNGFYDGFYIQKVKNNTNINDDKDWFYIDNLIQDFIIIDKGLASDTFITMRQKEIEENFDNKDTLKYFRTMVRKRV